MNNNQSLAMMIAGGALMAIGFPVLFFAMIWYAETEMWLGSFSLFMGLIIFKIGDNWLYWRETN